MSTGKLFCFLAKNKLQSVLDKNPGFKKVEAYAKVLSGSKVQGLNDPPHVISNFKFAPITSVDCERTFSVYKDLLTNKR